MAKVEALKLRARLSSGQASSRSPITFQLRQFCARTGGDRTFRVSGAYWRTSRGSSGPLFKGELLQLAGFILQEPRTNLGATADGRLWVSGEHCSQKHYVRSPY